LGIDVPIKIICHKHGEFTQTPYKHIYYKQGCPICSQSHLEEEISNFLVQNSIELKHKHHFDWLGAQHLDLYLPKYNIAIECQGDQHYIPKSFNRDKSDKTLAKNFKQQQERDSRKKKLCEENGVKLLYFTHYKNVKEDEITFKKKEKLLKYITNGK
jgi:hypothetical protein